MRILLVNKFIFPKGGAETYTFDVGKMLEEHGHEVQYFGLENEKNIVGNRVDSYVTNMDFSQGMSNKGYKEINTLTYAADVAVAISELIENESAYGETFHITTTESLSWEDVFKKYTSILSETTGKQFHIRYVDDIEMFYNIWNPYQIKYDCNIDRRFDNSKINRATNNKLQYTVFAEGINKCLKKFIESPEWRNINWKLNFWMDNITGEKTKIWDADGLKEKARYVKYCIKK